LRFKKKQVTLQLDNEIYSAAMKQSATSISKDFPIFFFGENRFLCIDLKKFKNKEIIEDLLDLADVEARKDEPVMPFEDFVKEENKRRGINV
jgi:hypothetical protein